MNATLQAGPFGGNQSAAPPLLGTVNLGCTQGDRPLFQGLDLQLNAGDKLQVLEEVYTSEYETAWSNRAIANLLYNYGRLC